MSQVQVRPANQSDINFVYSVWLRSYKHDSPQTSHINQKIFYENHQKTLDRLLSKDTSLVFVACDKTDPELLFGFVATRPHIKCLDYLYVKSSFRQMGVGSQLLKDSDSQNLEGWQCSHLTYQLLELWGIGKMKMTFNPYLL